MRNRLLVSLCVTTLLGATALGAGCGNSDDDNNMSTTGSGPDAGSSGSGGKGPGGTGAEAGTTTGGQVTNGDSGTTSDGGTRDSGGGAGKDGGPGVTVVTAPKSTCASANVLLSVEASDKISTDPTSFFSTIIAVDLNNDGAADLVGAGSNGSASGFGVALSKKDGTFAAPLADSEPTVGENYAMVGGDFDGDGLNDIVVAANDGENDNFLDFNAGKGDGTFKLPVSITISGEAIETLIAADFNGDGKLDIYYEGTAGEPNAATLLNQGGGMFAAPGTPLSFGNPTALNFVDLNGDKAADAVYYDGTANVCVALNNGSGSFANPGTCYPVSTGSSPSFIQFGDLNGDGKLDIVAVDDTGDQGSGGGINVFLGKGGGLFNDRQPYEFEFINSGLIVADLNNDGRADVAIHETFGSKAQADVYYANADGSLPAMASATIPLGTSSTNEVESFVAGDFDGNGLTGFATTYDYAGTESVVTATCKQ